MSERIASFNTILDQFEALWKGNQQPALARFLPSGNNAQQQELAWELIKLDLYYRVQAGEQAPVASRYGNLVEHHLTPGQATELGQLEDQWRAVAASTAVNISSKADLASARDRLPPLPPEEGQVEIPPQIGRYPVQGVIGRGGMGVVYRGFDPSLGRMLAIKVLRAEHRGDSHLNQRFLKEARIMGQLQHPGVAPIHETGVLPDGRPFFSMKQIEGHTLTALLAQRRPIADTSAHLGIFGQVCQTLAYAHARRIIHRDLKPDNVMVGAFGEVQVMDWGLAKILGESEAIAAADFEATVPGTVMGTLAYMAPEQARGEVERVDERSDVFGLGAMLCEILTGQPPYTAAKSYDRHMQAAAANLHAAMTRLQACAADPELIALARRCLAADPDQRPRHAGAVAEAVAKFQAQVQQRLQQAQVARAAAQVKAVEERKRRRISVALMAVGLAFVLAIFAAFVWYFEDQAVRTEMDSRNAADKAKLESDAQIHQLEQKANAADKAKLESAAELHQLEQKAQDKYVHKEVAAKLENAAKALAEIDEQLAHPIKSSVLLSNPERHWKAPLDYADEALQLAQALAGIGQVQTDRLDGTLKTRLADLAAQLKAARDDWQRAKKLDSIHFADSMLVDGKPSLARLRQQYAEAFASWGMDIAKDDPKQIAAKITKHRLRYVLVAALDHWATLTDPYDPSLTQVLEISRLSDPDPWRDKVRSTEARQNAIWSEQLAAQVKPQLQSPQVITLLAMSLPSKQRAKLLEQALLAHPRDFWLHFHLALEVESAGEKVAGFRAALTIRPESPAALFNLGVSLHAKGDVDRAIEAFLQAIALEPHYAEAHAGLGNALADKGDTKGSIAAYHKGIASDPKNADAHHNLGVTLLAMKDVDGAIAAFRQALACEPKHARAYFGLGKALQDKKQLDEAIASYRKAIEYDPQFANAHNNLGWALNLKGDREGAMAAYRQAIKWNPKHAWAYHNLGLALDATGDFDGAIAAHRKAIECDPKYVDARFNLAATLLRNGEIDEGLIVLRQLIVIDPSFAEAHFALSFVTRNYRYSLGEAVEFSKKAVELQPGIAKYHQELQESKRLHDLEKRVPDLVEGKFKPANLAEAEEFAWLCLKSSGKHYAWSVKLYKEVFAADKKLESRYREHAARAALLLAAGLDPTTKPRPQEAAELRQQAYQWLRGELDRVKEQPPRIGYTMLQVLKKDPALASTRDPALKDLPADERQLWQQFWADVDQLLATLSVQGKK